MQSHARSSRRHRPPRSKSVPADPSETIAPASPSGDITEDTVVTAASRISQAGALRQLKALRELLDDHDAALLPLSLLAPDYIGAFDETELDDWRRRLR